MLATSMLCIALTVYHESRNQPVPTQMAVASVVMNRAKQEHKSVCSVVKQPKQFSFVHNGRIPVPTDKHTFKLIKQRVAQNRANLSRKYTYFNHVSMGKRYQTSARPVRLAELLFY